MSHAQAQSTLASLRSQGAWRLDPARFHALEALARRLPAQAEPVRHLLLDKLQAGVAEYAQRCAQAQAADAPRPMAVKPPAVVSCAPLAQLNQYIRAASSASTGSGSAAFGESPVDELASARRFRHAWSSSRSQQQVQQAAARRPANAGPLNSHALVLQALELVRELSPDYLRRLLVQVESLQWLERARGQYPPAATNGAKPGKAAQGARRRTKGGSR